MENSKITWKTIKNKNYIVIKNKVYDVKEFKHQHPGGSQILEDWMGKDCTEIFNNVMHSKDAHDMMKDFYVGDLDTKSVIEEEPIDYWMIAIGVGVSAIVILFIYYKFTS
ncbi:Cytochrome b5 [Binucleata daphniae]